MADDNLLLAGLSAADRARLVGRLRPESLVRGAVLFEASAPVPHVWFPTRGLVSLEFAAGDGSTLELGAIGREGMVGAPLAHPNVPAPYAAVVRVAGSGFRVAAPAVAAALRQPGGLESGLLLYAVAQVTRVAENAHCHHSHSILERLARWLLTADDNVDDSLIEVTHDELSRALGSARSVVTKALAELERADAIWARPGRILIRKRARLEATVCVCYGRRLVRSVAAMPRGVRSSTRASSQSNAATVS